jgi:Family of unknown function (DUF6010)
MDVLGPVIVALVYIALSSLFKEPNRRSFNAIFIAGAGAAYRFIGVGWLLHTGWDVLHHLYGHPIVPFVPDSSFGCAITDPVIALWCFAGAPSVYDLFRGSSRGGHASGEKVTRPDARL